MIDLPIEQLEEVRRILKFVVPGYKALVFGSRVSGKAERFSDLDLVVVGPERLDFRLLERLRNTFSISDLPITVDVSDWHRLSPEFRSLVEAQCEELPLD
ncbi:MAG: nucleotidyltransferase domain-containing protein [bacterium]|nr:nucleotidyltransferase domain-containing protein [bacterium]